MHDLEIEWDAYVAYIVSFATLGVVWLEHHGMMIAVRRTSRRFIEITLLFLLFISLLPWPTALTAQFIEHHSTARVVTVLYSTNMLLIALTLAGSWAYLSRREEFLAPGLEVNFRASLPRTRMVLVPYLVAILVALLQSPGIVVHRRSGGAVPGRQQQSSRASRGWLTGGRGGGGRGVRVARGTFREIKPRRQP